MLEDSIWQQTLKQGHSEEAFKLYQQDPKDSVTLDFLETLVTLQTLLREKNTAQAQKLFLKAQLPEWANSWPAEFSPQLADLEKAQRHLDKHEPEKMLSVLTSVHHPLLLGEAETLRGTALIYHNDTLGAKAAFEKALSYDPKHYRAITNLGNLALENNQLEDAVLYYEKALKINQHFANAHHNLAVAYKRKGEVGKSVQALKQAQRASQQKLKEEARGMFKNSAVTKYLRWIFFAGLALVIYLFVIRR